MIRGNSVEKGANEYDTEWVKQQPLQKTEGTPCKWLYKISGKQPNHHGGISEFT